MPAVKAGHILGKEFYGVNLTGVEDGVFQVLASRRRDA
jgi:hypothetical protein